MTEDWAARLRAVPRRCARCDQVGEPEHFWCADGLPSIWRHDYDAMARLLEEEIGTMRAETAAKDRQLLADWEGELRLDRASDRQEIKQLQMAVAHAAYRTHSATADCERCRLVAAAVDAVSPRP